MLGLAAWRVRQAQPVPQKARAGRRMEAEA
jgi:hypothetical protein